MEGGNIVAGPLQSADLGLPSSGAEMRVPSSAVQRILDLLDADLSHIALDAGITTDAGLASEYYRAALTPPFRDGTTTVLEVYLDETQGNGMAAGVALIFGGSAEPGTGVLGPYQVLGLEKTELDSLTISVELTVEVNA